METLTKPTNATDKDFLPLNGTDYIEFYVGNAKQASYFYRSAFGFSALAYAGPETGVRDRASYVLRQNKITLVLTTPLHPGNEISQHIEKHGDGVKVLALMVDDAYKSFEETTKRGATAYLQPKTLKDDNGEVRLSGIQLYGDTVHLFIERKNYKGIFLPGLQSMDFNFRNKISWTKTC